MKKTIRRSQLISPWGVGQMINFPHDLSLMVCGLDAWDKEFEKAVDKTEFEIREPRLEKRLQVEKFYTPPDFRKSENRSRVSNPGLRIPCVRFPLWHYCPRCGWMIKRKLYNDAQERCPGYQFATGYSCKHDEKKRSFLIPVRFICVCEDGHIEDFPFMEWVHTEKEWNNTCQLRYLPGKNSSLSGIEITCTCGASRTLSGATQKGVLDSISKTCEGNRPWLGETKGTLGCGKSLTVVQKGASNVYFPIIASSIYLPSWEKQLNPKVIKLVEQNWGLLGSPVDDQPNQDIIRYFANWKRVDFQELLQVVSDRMQQEKTVDNTISTIEQEENEEEYRRPEYEAILNEKGGDNQDFYVKSFPVSSYKKVVTESFQRIVLAHKIRETRVFTGFSRLVPGDIQLLDKKRNLSLNPDISWLPAIVVRGEGIFFEFREDRLQDWIKRPSVKKRIMLLEKNWERLMISRNQEPFKFNPIFILIHTFAHSIINQLSYDCGYGSSSLRERLYCSKSNLHDKMKGVLIYTASGDTEGSMGGLVRQGNPMRLEETIQSALTNATWCSSDPICIHSNGQGPNSVNLAACHNCVLVPETSCEHGNAMLDRALLLGTPEDSSIGYFSLSC
ncbi:DUF1998 domain-containing protein [Shimazuella sp. AN120528]|uniref:DUF1998 domain-containing protein n=1 Tax=Shimazuella soli TaxID=1892854 RepID=UPI001F1116FD|nr:DUF1998 domain-containing protein [Shimazuella soli]MCH5586369.1 DUF1998 domain-containing protein [Shimazuella soli]